MVSRVLGIILSTWMQSASHSLTGTMHMGGYSLHVFETLDIRPIPSLSRKSEMVETAERQKHARVPSLTRPAFLHHPRLSFVFSIIRRGSSISIPSDPMVHAAPLCA
jgi:hypothetical protein